jgi:hypothetical protein
LTQQHFTILTENKSQSLPVLNITIRLSELLQPAFASIHLYWLMGSSLTGSRANNLLNSRFDQESCGVGFVAHLRGQSNHDILQLALTALGRLSHRGAVAGGGGAQPGGR